MGTFHETAKRRLQLIVWFFLIRLAFAHRAKEFFVCPFVYEENRSKTNLTVSPIYETKVDRFMLGFRKKSLNVKSLNMNERIEEEAPWFTVLQEACWDETGARKMITAFWQ